MSINDIIHECKRRDTKHSVKLRTRSSIGGFSVYRWKEFQDFMERLGVDWKAKVTRISITIPAQGPVKVIQCYQGVDTTTESEEIELTELE